MGKIVLVLLVLVLSCSTFATAESVIVNHVSDVTHIEIAGLGANDYQVNKIENTLILKINPVSETKLETLKNYKDKHILDVKVERSPALDQEIITFRLASADIEMFDYLTDAPSSLSIDLYYDDEPKTSNSKKNIADAESQEKNKVPKSATKQSIDEKDYKNLPVDRQLASFEFLKTIENTSLLNDLVPRETRKNVDIDDVKSDKLGQKLKKYFGSNNSLDMDIEKINFPIDILIEARDKVFLRFPLLLNESEYLINIIKKSVDYEIADNKNLETKDFIKAQKMFNKKDYKSFFKAKKILNKKYPNSKYTEMISFMNADALLESYEKEKNPEILQQALLTYDALVTKYPNSSLTERTYLLLAYLRMREEKFLDASRSLKSYVEIYKTSPLRENIKLILAQALMRTKQYKDAGNVYQELSSSESPDIKETASFDIGDAFLEKKEYQSAIRYYRSALASYPSAVPKHPNIYFNLGEAYFMTEDYKESLKAYRSFIEQHPIHRYSSYAWTRMGEILEIANKEETIWRGFYNESIFRFNNEDGARIARIHLIYHEALKIQEHKLDIFLKELKNLSTQIKLNYVEDFIAFKISDIFYNRGQYEKAIDSLIAFFKDAQIPLEAEKFHKRIGRAIAGYLENEIEKGSADEGLRALKKYDELWIRKSNLQIFDYLKGRVYAKAGMHEVAVSYYRKYLAALEKSMTLGAQEKWRSPDTSFLYLAKSHMALTQIPEVLTQIEKIKPANLTKSEHVEFLKLKRDIAIARKDYPEAQSLAEKITVDSKSDMYTMVHIYESQNAYEKAATVIDNYVNTFKPTEDEKFEVLKAKLDVLSKLADKEKYNSYLKKFYSQFKNTKSNFDKEKLDLSKVYFEESDFKSAEEVMGRITKNTIWDKLAMENATQYNWNQKYKKYVDRVPAMQNKKEQ